MKDDLPQKLDEYEIVKRYIKSIDKGLLKVMSKMGISTYQSYCGAQIFDAVGLKSDFVAEYFTGTATRIEGVVARRDRRGDRAAAPRRLRRRADLSRRARRRRRILSFACAARTMCGPRPRCRRSSTPCAATCRTSTAPTPRSCNEQSERLLTIRGLFRLKTAEEDGRKPVPIEEVEPAKDIVRRFCHRRDVVRLDLARSAYHARDRHEPHRRQVEYRRRRRGGRPLQAAAERRFHALGDQAGGLGPLRRDDGIPRQLRHDADQDGAGRQARRRRPAARAQGRQDHRQGAPLDARRRPDLAAAAPRHLFDRGPGAAHLRPEERQSRRAWCR